MGRKKKKKWPTDSFYEITRRYKCKYESCAVILGSLTYANEFNERRHGRPDDRIRLRSPLGWMIHGHLEWVS